MATYPQNHWLTLTPNELTSRIQQLNHQSYAVTQEGATEPSFRNVFYDHYEPGLYVDIISGEPLFCSLHKYNSGTGWPSFTQAISPNAVITQPDNTLGSLRTELRSRIANSHLGHAFDDGPYPTQKRYCINSCSLRFVPIKELQEQGYLAYIHLFTYNHTPSLWPKPSEDIAVVAGGCFWGIQALLSTLPGMIETTCGYSGGIDVHGITYDLVSKEQTGHAEALMIHFNPQILSYTHLLQCFFKIHCPTTLNRQGYDVGTRYRSCIFYAHPKQHTQAQAVIQEAKHYFNDPIVTEVVALDTFHTAEAWHQYYFKNFPNQKPCHSIQDHVFPSTPM